MLGKFTPGPWTVEETAETYWIGTVRANTHKVGEVITGMDHGPYTEEAEARIHANANLIAAAPLGYALAEEIVNHLYEKQDIDRVRVMAKEFLEAANGSR